MGASSIKKKSTVPKSTKRNNNVPNAKHRYPRNSYAVHESLCQTGSLNNHLSILDDLVTDIFKKEKATILEYFSSEESKHLMGKKNILEVLTDVMSETTDEIRAKRSKNDVKFSAELTKHDKSELNSLLATKQLMQRHSEELTRCLNDFPTFATTNNLWSNDEALLRCIDKVDDLAKNNPDKARLFIIYTCFKS